MSGGRKVVHLVVDGKWFTVCGRPAASLHYSGALPDITCNPCKYSTTARRLREGVPALSKDEQA